MFRYFNNAPVIHVEGRLHDVKIMYTEEAEDDVVDAAVSTVLQIHLELPKGLLYFLGFFLEIQK